MTSTYTKDFSQKKRNPNLPKFEEILLVMHASYFAIVIAYGYMGSFKTF
jgi:hypothetical protein